MKTTCLIGWVCNGWKSFSWPVLIGRLVYLFYSKQHHFLVKCISFTSKVVSNLTWQLTYNLLTLKVLSKYIMVYLLNASGGYREEETPCPISNQEAKLFIADDTLPYWDGNVGRRRFRVIYPNLYLYIPFLLYYYLFHYSYLYLCLLYIHFFI